MSVSINLHNVTEIVATKPSPLKGTTPITWTSEIILSTSDGDEIIWDLFAESEEALFVHTNGTVVITGDKDE